MTAKELAQLLLERFEPDQEVYIRHRDEQGVSHDTLLTEDQLKWGNTSFGRMDVVILEVA